MADLDLDALEVLASAATDGPWRAERQMGNNGDWVDIVDAGGSSVSFSDWKEGARILVPSSDAEFIAASRDAVPALIARVRELEAQRDAMVTEVEALEQSDWLRDTVAGDRLRAVLTTPDNTEKQHGVSDGQAIWNGCDETADCPAEVHSSRCWRSVSGAFDTERSTA